jgi:hypothetical protein
LDNHAYHDFVVNIANTPGRAFYRQPGGLEPDAENRDRLEAGYYERIAANNDPSVVMRLVHNKFGYSRHGQPVYEAFDRQRHVAAQPLAFQPNLDLVIGIDLSMNTLNPAAVFIQAPGGRVAVIDELPCEHGTGAARFGEMLALRIAERYQGARNVRCYADPAASYGADREGGQMTAMETVGRALGLPVMVPANGSNELGMRLDAVKAELRGYLDANTHLTLCPLHCKELIAGFEGKYRFKKKPRTASHEFEEVPDKTHPHSDLHDALQYAILGLRGRAGAVRGAVDGRRAQEAGTSWSQKRRAGGFDVHKVGVK